MTDMPKGFRKGGYSECLTRVGNYVACYRLDPMRNLASSTEAQEVFQDHGRSAISKERYRQGVDLVLGKTRFGGFFFARRKYDLLLLWERVQILLFDGQWLTPECWYVLCLPLTDVVNLDPSTESQDALRITDDRP